MLLCFVFTNLAATAIPRRFGERLTETVAKVLNMPVERITVVTQPGLPMVKAGSSDPAVLIQIQSIAVFDAEKNLKYSEQFLDFLKNEFKLPANRFMLEYVDLPAYMVCGTKLAYYQEELVSESKTFLHDCELYIYMQCIRLD